MQDANEKQATCPHCGRQYPAAAGVCPDCGGTGEGGGVVSNGSKEWARTRDGLKTKWVASVIAFWVSAAVLGVVFFVDRKLNLVLTSICVGMLVIGMVLKARYQLHLRKDPSRR
jgi:hypothetical protein